jgi:hypothetical protein
MTIKTTTDKAAVVDTAYHWIPIAERQPPRGSKVQLIDDRLGVAVYGPYSPKSTHTHWAPLPTFKKG